MSHFQQGLELVHDALRQLQQNGVDLRASTAVLQQLREARVVEESAPVPPAKAPVSLTSHVAEDAPVFATAQPSAFPEPPVVPAAPPATREALTVAVEQIEPVLTPGERSRSKAEQLAEIRGPILGCTKCPHLVKSRTQVVFGVGNAEAELMFVGEAPGEDEDLQGEPFVGKAGELLTKIIVAMGKSREEIYIANVLKCRPDMPKGVSGNRKPKPEEMQTCLPYLQKQIAIIQPKVIVALGATAMEGLTGNTTPVGKLRGHWQEFAGIPLMVTYHPAYLLRNQALSEKRKVWEDLLLVLEKLGWPISEKQRNFFLPKG